MHELAWPFVALVAIGATYKQVNRWVSAATRLSTISEANRKLDDSVHLRQAEEIHALNGRVTAAEETLHQINERTK